MGEDKPRFPTFHRPDDESTAGQDNTLPKGTRRQIVDLGQNSPRQRGEGV